MGKKKLSRFKELESLERVFQPPFEEVFRRDHDLKGLWCSEVFGNNQELVLELGCGKGEYTVGLARRYPQCNFIGLDIKGARIWTGAKEALNEGLSNVVFLRTRIDFVNSFFAQDEVSEIWITFPDPQENKRRQKKRLPGAHFLNMYRAFLKDGGRIHLKTDNLQLYKDTLELVLYNKLDVEHFSTDVYSEEWNDERVSIQTYYEKRFLSEGIKINYLCFKLPAGKEIRELPDEAK
ncbi:MAG: tRNA (guanosine(46)-N7)-methyltransferase TrmB [Bacteroidota bacterium]|nr:tRNA (guanosine(46)-N7)-methyltransferase TrmB [Bacteroidota bacterium]